MAIMPKHLCIGPIQGEGGRRSGRAAAPPPPPSPPNADHACPPPEPEPTPKLLSFLHFFFSIFFKSFGLWPPIPAQPARHS
uniref:Uncharacterized protein n=1 Tax=Rhizophora mucronata TaxID=61149 RepID=A0A2P2P6G8_RHIMU